MEYGRVGATRQKPGVEHLDSKNLVAAVEAVSRRLELLQADQRLILEKLNRLHLVIKAMRAEQGGLKRLLASSSAAAPEGE
jgi:hypothetical protein